MHEEGKSGSARRASIPDARSLGTPRRRQEVPPRGCAIRAQELAIRAACYIETTHLMEATMKLSARNILKGKITDVKKGQTTTHVHIDIGGAVVTSSIT